MTFTLPADADGLNYLFVNSEEVNMTITADTADTMIVCNDLAGDSLAFDQAGYDVGSAAFVFSDGTNWHALPIFAVPAVNSVTDYTFFTVNT